MWIDWRPNQGHNQVNLPSESQRWYTYLLFRYFGPQWGIKFGRQNIYLMFSFITIRSGEDALGSTFLNFLSIP